jgi:sulfur carrier protein ThiS
MVTVKAGKLPGKVDEYSFEAEPTISEVLGVAGIGSEGFEIKLNGEVATLDSECEDGSIILLVKKIKGNA